jgi:hypothetical protein
VRCEVWKTNSRLKARVVGVLAQKNKDPILDRCPPQSSQCDPLGEALWAVLEIVLREIDLPLSHQLFASTLNHVNSSYAFEKAKWYYSLLARANPTVCTLVPTTQCLFIATCAGAERGWQNDTGFTY